MDFKNIKYEVEGEVGILTINRPDKLNALNTETVSEIGNAMDLVKKEDNTKVLVLTGAGNKAFMAGADISEFVDLDSGVCMVCVMEMI
jgi:enoyl-CoA hydratase